MKIFFEEYGYDQDLVTKYIPGFYTSPPRKGEVKIPYVGYYFNTDPEVMDSVFILPKVFLNSEGLAFGKFKPEEIFDASKENSKLRESNYYSEIFHLSVWIYRSIAHYIERHPDEDISERDKLQDVISVNGDSSQTYLDTILQLIKFNNEHRNLFTYISKINSRGNNRVHWGKTISHVTPFMQEDEPVYLKFMNKNKTMNVDEELIVLFYSVLDYLREKYNFKIVKNLNYETDIRYVERLIKTGRGTRVMRAMRKKYFTDELVALWKLLNVFFQKAESVSARKYHDETLLIKNYNLVFEDMIDELISDETREIYPDLKEQDDGKIVDHIYRYGSLIGDDFLYYIGDSKYYKEGNEPGKNSIYKQFTYAKNVIQYNMDIFNNAKGREKKDRRKGDIRYRDELTEGYNITPNFFIRGKVNHDNLNYTDDELKKEGEDGFIDSFHYKNRLFDRDTLLLQKYSINFLYVLSSYASKHNDDNYKEEVRQKFRQDLISELKVRYKFLLLQSKGGNLSEVINKHFRLLNGRIYKSFNDDRIVMFAYERKKRGLLKLLNELSGDFNFYEYQFSDEPNVLVQIHNSKKIIVNPVKKESEKKQGHQLRLDFGDNSNLEFEHADEPEVLAKLYETPFEEDGLAMEVAETPSRDISEELADLLDAKGANFVRLLKQIASHGEFRPVENEKCIFCTGGERSEDFPNLLDAARKAVGLGYKVYILPNPKGIRTADFIFERKGVIGLYDLKTIQGKASVSNRLNESIGQTNRVLLNIKTDYNGRLLASDIKSFFEKSRDAIEVLVFKGNKTISIKRGLVQNPAFNRLFRKLYEK